MMGEILNTQPLLFDPVEAKANNCKVALNNRLIDQGAVLIGVARMLGKV